MKWDGEENYLKWENKWLTRVLLNWAWIWLDSIFSTKKKKKIIIIKLWVEDNTPKIYFCVLLVILCYEFLFKVTYFSSVRELTFRFQMVNGYWRKPFFKYWLLWFTAESIWWKVCFTQQAAAKLLTTEHYIEQMLESCLSNRMKRLDDQRALTIIWTFCPNQHRVAWPLGLDVWVLETELSYLLSGNCQPKVAQRSFLFIVL